MFQTSPPRALTLMLVCALALTLTVAPALAADKSYTMPTVSIDATVQRNGDVTVREQRTFDFSGSFSWLQWRLLEKNSSGIEIIGVEGPTGRYRQAAAEGEGAGTYTVIDDGTATTLKIFHATADAQATFTIDYVAKGAAVRWADTSELYWQFVGDESEIGVGTVRILIHLPEPYPKTDVQVWAHGPLTGTIYPEDGGLVNVAVDDLPPYTYVEPRVLFPESGLSEAPVNPAPRLEQARAEEALLADSANAERRATRTRVYGSLGVGILVPLLALAGALLLFFRYGKERTSSYPGGYFRELPADLPPAIVGALWRFGTIGDAETVATLMDLANRGVISVKPTTVTTSTLFGNRTENTYQLTLDASKWQSLHVIEQELLSFLFTTIAGSTTLTLAGLKEEAKSRPQTFASGMTDWKNAVSAEADRQGFFESAGGSLKWFFIVGAMGITFLGIMTASLAESAWPFLSAFPCSVAIGVIAFQMPRRAPAANELYAKYRGLRDYLRDFSRLDEAPPMHIVVWEHFLVMAVVFGIAEKVIEAMRVKIPQVFNDPGLAHSIWWVSSGSGYASPASIIAGGFASAASVATSAMSSSSGGGGGFSDGGGGGGGGGGVSAG